MDPSPKTKGLRPYPRHWHLELVGAARLPWALARVKGIKETYEVKKKFFSPRWESNPRRPD